MIPSIFEYLPEHAPALFTKIAESALRDDPTPEVIPPDVPAEPRVERPPPHPYAVGLKKMLPIGLGTAAGYVAGAGLPLLYQKIYNRNAPINPYLLQALGLGSSVVGGMAGGLLSQGTQAEVDRASQEYKDYLARRAGSSADPAVQPPPVRP